MFPVQALIYLTEEGLITNDPNVRVVCRVCDATRAGTNANWSAQEIAGFLLNTEALQRDKVMQLLSYEFQVQAIRFFRHTSFWMDGRSSRHHRFICWAGTLTTTRSSIHTWRVAIGGAECAHNRACIPCRVPLRP